MVPSPPDIWNYTFFTKIKEDNMNNDRMNVLPKIAVGDQEQSRLVVLTRVRLCLNPQNAIYSCAILNKFLKFYGSQFSPP